MHGKMRVLAIVGTLAFAVGTLPARATHELPHPLVASAGGTGVTSGDAVCQVAVAIVITSLTSVPPSATSGTAQVTGVQSCTDNSQLASEYIRLNLWEGPPPSGPMTQIGSTYTGCPVNSVTCSTTFAFATTTPARLVGEARGVWTTVSGKTWTTETPVLCSTSSSTLTCQAFADVYV
jgi:hypothetical protein